MCKEGAKKQNKWATIYVQINGKFGNHMWTIGIANNHTSYKNNNILKVWSRLWQWPVTEKKVQFWPIKLQNCTFFVWLIYNTQPLCIDAFCLFSVRSFDKWHLTFTSQIQKMITFICLIELKVPDYKSG